MREGSRELRIKMERAFFEGEYADNLVYTSLAKEEKDKNLRELLEKLAGQEKKHTRAWAALLEEEGAAPGVPRFAFVKVLIFSLFRKLLGTAFMTKLLERNEVDGMRAYTDAVKSNRLSRKGDLLISQIMKDETVHQHRLLGEVWEREVSLDYIKSMIFGLNDGLVEVLAAVAGLAALATTSTVVVMGGIIIGISGTLSMAGGDYLASKSQNVVTKAVEQKDRKEKLRTTDPLKDAYYTGLFYFLGAVIPILPFAFGAVGYYGIGVAMVLDVVALIIASVIIGIISSTNIKRRVFEMLIISLGAALVTIAVGTIAKVYFKISV